MFDEALTQRHTYGGIGHDDHDVRVGSEDIDESRKVRVADLHALELRLRLAVSRIRGDFRLRQRERAEWE